MNFKKLASAILAAGMILSVSASAILKEDAPQSVILRPIVEDNGLQRRPQAWKEGAQVGVNLLDGVYTGEANGFGGKIVVEVTLSGNTIEAIKVVENHETPGVGTPALETLPEQIIKAQGLGIDGVAGATFSSKGLMAAVEAALASAGVDVEALKTVGLEVAKEEDVELTADVVVIGGGGAGLAAAVKANQIGASVIVIEKMPKVGGNTILAGGALNAVDDGSETALTHDDSVAFHYTQTFNGGDKQGNPELVTVLTENAWEGVEWLKSLGMQFKDGVFTVTGGMWPRAHKPEMPVGTGFFDTYMRYINGHDNVEVLLNTKAESIEMVDGKAATVIATGATGNKVVLHANNGVVVATGGFSKNVELREKFNVQWPTLGANIKSTNHEGATGDAIPMLEKLGANFVQMNYIQLLPLGDPETGSLSGNIEFDVERRIFVNKEGKRFVNEGGRRDEMTLALFEQPDNYMWIIMDSDCYPTGDEKNNFNETANELIAAGRAFKGETLEELAEKIGVPAENLVASVNDFNAHVATKEKDEFGRVLYSTPIDNGPFYAAPRVPTVHHTMGGVQINTICQVINTEGEVIPGLYAAGEVTGGIHGTNRLGGNALTDTVVFGRIAGTSAALCK